MQNIPAIGGIEDASQIRMMLYQSGRMVHAPLDSALNLVTERGSNANGQFLRLKDGTQICWHTLTLTFNAGSNLDTTWAFPQAFIAAPIVTATASSGSITPSVDMLGYTRFLALGTASVRINQVRVSGMTNFQSGDNLLAHAVAFGRWS